MLLKQRNTIKEESFIYNTLVKDINSNHVRLERFAFEDIDPRFERPIYHTNNLPNSALVKTTIHGKLISTDTIIFDEFSYNEVDEPTGKDLLYMNNTKSEVSGSNNRIINPIANVPLVTSVTELMWGNNFKFKTTPHHIDNSKFTHQIEAYENQLQMDYFDSLLNIDLALNSGSDSIPFGLEGIIDSKKKDGVWFDTTRMFRSNLQPAKSLRELERYLNSLTIAHKLLRNYCMKTNTHVKIYFQNGPGGVIYRTHLDKFNSISRISSFDSIDSSKMMKSCSALYGRNYDNSEIIYNLLQGGGSVLPLINILENEEKEPFIQPLNDKVYYQSVDPIQKENI